MTSFYVIGNVFVSKSNFGINYSMTFVTKLNATEMTKIGQNNYIIMILLMYLLLVYFT